MSQFFDYIGNCWVASLWWRLFFDTVMKLPKITASCKFSNFEVNVRTARIIINKYITNTIIKCTGLNTKLPKSTNCHAKFTQLEQLPFPWITKSYTVCGLGFTLRTHRRFLIQKIRSNCVGTDRWFCESVIRVVLNKHAPIVQKLDCENLTVTFPKLRLRLISTWMLVYRSKFCALFSGTRQLIFMLRFTTSRNSWKTKIMNWRISSKCYKTILVTEYVVFAIVYLSLEFQIPLHNPF